MCRLAIVLVASLALAATCCSAGKLDVIRERYRKIRGGHQSPAGYHLPAGHHHSVGHHEPGYGPSSPSAASAAAAANNGGSASSAATAAGNYAPHAPHHQPHQASHFQYAPESAYAPYAAPPVAPRFNRVGNSGGAAAASAAASSAAPQAPVYQTAPRYNYQPSAYYAPQPAYVPAPVQRRYNTGGSAASAAAAASSGGSGYNTVPQHIRQYPPVHYEAPLVAAPRYAAPVQPHYVAPSGGSAASSAAAAASGGAGGSAAASSAAAAGAQSAHVVEPINNVIAETETYDEHFEEPETLNTHSEAHGTYANNGNGHESSSYVRSTEDVQNHEDGRQDDNHYYNAQSYGKTYDENNHEAFNDLVDDVVHTPNLFKSSKRSTNYVKDQNKARRESGSGVLAHDKHSSSYNKNSRKFNEQVDQRNHKAGAGIVDTSSFSENHNIDDEDLESYDSDGLGTFVGVDGVHHPAVRHQGGPRAATATSAVSDGGVSTSAAVGQNAASSSSAASGH